MILECEGKLAIQSPTLQQIRMGISQLTTYGLSSYASLTDHSGNYVQVAGGRVTCLLEYYRSDTKVRLLGFHDKPSKVGWAGPMRSMGKPIGLMKYGRADVMIWFSQNDRLRKLLLSENRWASRRYGGGPAHPTLAVVVDSISDGTAYIRDPLPQPSAGNSGGTAYSIPINALENSMTGKAVFISPPTPSP